MRSTRFKSSVLRFLFIAAIVSLASCLSKSDADNQNSNNGPAIDKDTTAEEAGNVFYYIPSPVELVDLIKRAGATYDKSFLNSADNLSRYTSSTAQALNLGVYGADLSMAGIFNRTEESLTYMGCANRLANSLRIGSVFNGDMRTRLEKNISDRDSVTRIIADAYWDCDALLQENKQQHASALMIAGGWIEGLYLACRVAEKTNNSAIRFRVAEQRFPLDQLVDLLGKQKNADVQSLRNELKELQTLFAQLPSTMAAASNTVVEEDSIPVIGADNSPEPVSLNALELKQILELVSRIRNGITSRS
jgi:hypothetical protein